MEFLQLSQLVACLVYRRRSDFDAWAKLGDRPAFGFREFLQAWKPDITKPIHARTDRMAGRAVFDGATQRGIARPSDPQRWMWLTHGRNGAGPARFHHPKVFIGDRSAVVEVEPQGGKLQ